MPVMEAVQHFDLRCEIIGKSRRVGGKKGKYVNNKNKLSN
jgi:hypothetical protein